MLWFVLHVIGAHLKANAMWVNSFTHMSCQSVGLLETIFPSSKKIPPYLQYVKELFACWSCHTPLTGLLDTDPSPIDTPLEYLTPVWTWLLSLPSCHITRIWTPAGWRMAMHSTGGRGWGGVRMYTQAYSKNYKRIIECINKCDGHTRYYNI